MGRGSWDERCITPETKYLEILHFFCESAGLQRENGQIMTPSIIQNYLYRMKAKATFFQIFPKKSKTFSEEI